MDFTSYKGRNICSWTHSNHPFVT